MQVLREGARAALAAPSIFNTQPWRWQVSGDVLRLWADRERQLLVADPDGRMLTISCGVALHHACLALAAAGHRVEVRRLPDPDDTDLLAQVRVVGPYRPEAREVALREAMSLRRTDRRAFPLGVPDEAAGELVRAAASGHAHLHPVRRNGVSTLALAAARAGALELADPAYRRELIRWTHHPQWSSDGVPIATAARPTARAVPVRGFAPSGGHGLSAGAATDVSAQYALVFTVQDTPLDWLYTGEALSAVLLTATGLGLATAPISDVTELAVTREQLRELLAGIGVPQLAVRIGHPPPGPPPPNAPRRPHDEVIYP